MFCVFFMFVYFGGHAVDLQKLKTFCSFFTDKEKDEKMNFLYIVINLSTIWAMAPH